MSFNGPDYAHSFYGGTMVMGTVAGYAAEQVLNKMSKIAFPNDENRQINHEIKMASGSIVLTILGVIKLISSGQPELAMIATPALASFHLALLGFALNRRVDHLEAT